MVPLFPKPRSVTAWITIVMAALTRVSFVWRDSAVIKGTVLAPVVPVISLAREGSSVPTGTASKAD